jgi:P-type Cu+ transporter
MYVEESPSALQTARDGQTYYFCSESCLRTFLAPTRELRSLKLNIALSLALGVPILILSYLAVSPTLVPTGVLLLLLATPVQFVAGRGFYRGAWDAIKTRSSNMDLLVALGTSAAYFYSVAYVLSPGFFPSGGLFFDVSSIVIALILVGKFLEQSVSARANDAVRKLAELQPKTASLVTPDGREVQTPIERIAPGDVLLVRPGQKIPTDAQVLEGHSYVDEKLVTGESVPVEKYEGDQVIGGTLNGNGALKVRATRVGSDTTLASIARLVREAQATKAPVERMVNVVSTYFVPAVLAVALTSFLLWVFVGGKPVSFAFTAAVAVLVVACPCALGLATPAAISVGAGKGAQNGILIKGGEYLQRTGEVTTVAFDKTGTLTEGRPSVTDILPIHEGTDPHELIFLAAIAEKNSEHPIASAIARRHAEYVDGPPIPSPEEFVTVPGQGVRAVYRGKELLLGSSDFVSRLGPPDETFASRLDALRGEGKTVVELGYGGALIGAVAVADRLKPSSKPAIDALHKMGIRTVMISGDGEKTSKAVAGALGIQRYYSEVLPGRKSEVVKTLQSEGGGRVAMVGDGINDAPALAQADVGIAVGSGSDIAMETGGIILMRDDLTDVAAGIQLSKKMMSKVRQNLFWAFAYNVALIPVAAGALYVVAGILLSPILSGAAMAMSSVSVVSNSLTLRRFKPSL